MSHPKRPGKDFSAAGKASKAPKADATSTAAIAAARPSANYPSFYDKTKNTTHVICVACTAEHTFGMLLAAPHVKRLIVCIPADGNQIDQLVAAPAGCPNANDTPPTLICCEEMCSTRAMFEQRLRKHRIAQVCLSCGKDFIIVYCICESRARKMIPLTVQNQRIHFPMTTTMTAPRFSVILATTKTRKPWLHRPLRRLRVLRRLPSLHLLPRLHPHHYRLAHSRHPLSPNPILSNRQLLTNHLRLLLYLLLRRHHPHRPVVQSRDRRWRLSCVQTGSVQYVYSATNRQCWRVKNV